VSRTFGRLDFKPAQRDSHVLPQPRAAAGRPPRLDRAHALLRVRAEDEFHNDTADAKPVVRCPHCGRAFVSVGWLSSDDGVLTYYHNDPGCMMALNCQRVPVELTLGLEKTSNWRPTDAADSG
jgi:hypothetical protein